MYEEQHLFIDMRTLRKKKSIEQLKRKNMKAKLLLEEKALR